MDLVSVILPVFNARSTLEACLRSILANDYPELEVIMVDDGSGDDSLAIAHRLRNSDPRLRVLSVDHGGPARARNHGIRAASGDTIFFTDSDVLAPTDWISGICSELSLRDAAAVGGGVRPLRLSSRYEEAEHFRYLRLIGDQPRYIGALPTCNLAVRRPVLDAVGLFDERFKLPASEDYDLCFRINDMGHRIWYAPDCAIYHRHPDSLRPIIRRGFIQGREGARLARKRRGNRNNWSSGLYTHCLENGAVFSYWLLRHVPGIPRGYRWIVAAYDLSFAVGWCSHRAAAEPGS